MTTWVRPISCLVVGAALSLAIAVASFGLANPRPWKDCYGAAGQPYAREGFPMFSVPGTQLLLTRVYDGPTCGYAYIQGTWIQGLTKGPLPTAPVTPPRGAWCEAGWPRRCVRAVMLDGTGFRAGGRPREMFWSGSVMPRPQGQLAVLRVRWGALTLDTAICGGCVFLVLSLAGYGRRLLRSRCGLCPACAYPVGVSDRCTECGAKVTPRPAPPAAGAAV
jgi:hypothetical protein